jgi:hypothetical protein
MVRRTCLPLPKPRTAKLPSRGEEEMMCIAMALFGTEGESALVHEETTGGPITTQIGDDGVVMSVVELFDELYQPLPDLSCREK